MNSDLKPSFIRSKGERRNLELDVMDEFRKLAASFYIWTGLPDDVPEGYLEAALFDRGCIGAKVVKGLGVIICPASTKVPDIYHRPKIWIPAGLTIVQGDPINMMEESSNPALFLGKPMCDIIAPYVDTLEDALISLNQNVVGMRQPIAFEGAPGNVADSLVLDYELKTGVKSIPVVSSTQVKAEVIDLGVQDFTHPLIEVRQDMEGKILTLMSIDSQGVEKASGVNMQESTAHQGKLVLTSTEGLTIRQKWCDKINPVLKEQCAALGIPFTPFSVAINPKYQEAMEPPEPEPNQGGENDGE